MSKESEIEKKIETHEIIQNIIKDNNNDKNDNYNVEIKQNKEGKLIWNIQTEDLLVSWADNAACYKWLHEETYKKYSFKKHWFALPIIILSAALGLLNVGLQGYVPQEYMNLAQACIGGINFFVTVLTIIQNYFKYAESSDDHHKVSMGWSKFHRNIVIELSVDIEHRGDADGFIRFSRKEYDRLLEESPTIPDDIILRFNDEFKKIQKKKDKKINKLQKDNIKTKLNKQKSLLSKQSFFSSTQFPTQTNIDLEPTEESLLIEELERDKLIVPDICGSISHTKVYRPKIKSNPVSPNNINFSNSSNPSIHDDNYDKINKKPLDDKIKELDERISGVNQSKLAMIGQKLGPLYSLLVETMRFNEDNHNPNISHYHNNHNIIKEKNKIKIDDKHIDKLNIINNNVNVKTNITRNRNTSLEEYINPLSKPPKDKSRSIFINNSATTNSFKDELKAKSEIFNKNLNEKKELDTIINRGNVKSLINRYTINLGHQPNTPIDLKEIVIDNNSPNTNPSTPIVKIMSNPSSPSLISSNINDESIKLISNKNSLSLISSKIDNNNLIQNISNDNKSPSLISSNIDKIKEELKEEFISDNDELDKISTPSFSTPKISEIRNNNNDDNDIEMKEFKLE